MPRPRLQPITPELEAQARALIAQAATWAQVRSATGIGLYDFKRLRVAATKADPELAARIARNRGRRLTTPTTREP